MPPAEPTGAPDRGTGDHGSGAHWSPCRVLTTPHGGDSLHPALAAWVLAAAATVAGAAAGALALAAGDPVSWKPLLLPALWSLPGALIAAGRPRIAVGWLMLAVALLFAGSGLAEAWVRHGGPVGWAAAVWFVDRFSAVLVAVHRPRAAAAPGRSAAFAAVASARWRRPSAAQVVLVAGVGTRPGYGGRAGLDVGRPA